MHLAFSGLAHTEVIVGKKMILFKKNNVIHSPGPEGFHNGVLKRMVHGFPLMYSVRAGNSAQPAINPTRWRWTDRRKERLMPVSGLGSCLLHPQMCFELSAGGVLGEWT